MEEGIEVVGTRRVWQCRGERSGGDSKEWGGPGGERGFVFVFVFLSIKFKKSVARLL